MVAVRGERDTSRRWKLAAYKSGDVVILRKVRDCPYGALIFFSTDTKEEAELLVQRTCRLSYCGRRMILNRGEFSNVDELHDVAAEFRTQWLKWPGDLKAELAEAK